MAGTVFLQYKDIMSSLSMDDFSQLCQDSLYEVLLSREPNVILDFYHAKVYHRVKVMTQVK